MTDPSTECRFSDSEARSGRTGTVEVEVPLSGQVVSSCRIIPLRLRIGAAAVRVDGIGEVRTPEEHRNKGFARQVMNAALKRMEAGDAALTMLYGITDFYPKFGYITVGPESSISLPPLDGEERIPEGYCVRPFTPSDLPEVQRLYDGMTADSVGTAVRPHDGYPWTRLRDAADTECQVVTGSEGRVAAYAWRGKDLTFVRAHSAFRPDDLIVGEVAAADSHAAAVALTRCRRWAAEEKRKQVTLFLPHEGPVAAAAMQMTATLARDYGPDGGWMACVLSAERLLSSLQPELSRRLAQAHNRFRGVLRLVTETEAVSFAIGGDEVRCLPDSGSDGDALTCRLPQTTLARLALGCYPPDDLLARLPDPPQGQVLELLQMMFPPRPAQLFLADRF